MAEKPLQRIKVILVDAGEERSFDPGRRSEFDCRRAGTPAELERLLSQASADVIVILDAPPRIDALALSASLRNQNTRGDFGVLVVLQKSDMERTLAAFSSGADDCLSSPLDPRILHAHVRALAWRYARRAVSPESRVIKQGPFRLDANRCEIDVEGKKVPLTSTEVELLTLLFLRPGWVVRRAMLASRLKGGLGNSYLHAVDTHISNLRRKLGRHGGKIVAAKGLGYRLAL